MHKNIDVLCELMGLNDYQSGKLKVNSYRYNFSRLQKRGGVLYAPYATHGVWQYLGRILFGAQADLIGQKSVLLQAQRGIRFCANGYHCVKVGRHVYYANGYGQVVSKREFMQNKSK